MRASFFLLSIQSSHNFQAGRSIDLLQRGHFSILLIDFVFNRFRDSEFDSRVLRYNHRLAGTWIHSLSSFDFLQIERSDADELALSGLLQFLC